jgi:phosphate uptake regulator
METRKIQITGKSTYIVTLPKKWAIKSGMEAGALVNISYQEDGSLMIIPPKKSKNASVVKKLSMKGNLEELKTQIIGAYILGGYSVLEVKVEGLPEAKKEVKELCRNLIGFEIVGGKSSKILIQDFLDMDEFTIEAGLKRMASLVFFMFNELLEALQLENPETLKGVVEKDADVDTMFYLLSKLYISRLNLKKVSKNDNLSLIDAFYYRCVAENLKRIGAQLAKVAQSFEREKFSAEGMEKFQELGCLTQQLVSDSVRAFRLSDLQLAKNALNEKNEFEKQFFALKNLEKLPLFEILDSFDRIKDYAGNIAEFTIDLSQL